MKKILIVDYIKENLIITQEILKPKFEVIAAENLQNALNILNEFKPDIVLINQIIPGSSGADILKLLAKDKNDFLAMLMTSVKDIEMIVEAILHGFDGFIKMPVEMERFEKQLETADKIHQMRMNSDNFLKVKTTKAMSLTFAHYTRNILTPLVGNLSNIKGHIPEDIFNSFEKNLNKLNKLTYKIEELLRDGVLNEFSYSDKTEFYDLKLDD